MLVVHLTSIPCCSTDKSALQTVFDLCKGSVPETFHNLEFMKELTSPPFISHTSLVTYTILQCWYTFNVNKNPTDATVCRYLFTAKLLYMFRVSQHPSSGILKTVPAASGTGHTTCTTTPLQCGLIGTDRVLIKPCWRGVAVQVVWPVPAAGTVFNTPDDGCCDTWNM